MVGGGGGGKRYVKKSVYVCGTIPPVFWYSYPNCAPQAPQGKRSHGWFDEREACQKKLDAVGAMPPNPLSLKTGGGGVAYKDPPPPGGQSVFTNIKAGGRLALISNHTRAGQGNWSPETVVW